MKSTTTTERPSVWQLQTAKAQFSKVVAQALDSGPQLVTRSGRPAVYVVSAKTFEEEIAGRGSDRKEVLLASPHREITLDLERDPAEGREVVL